ncbi:MAG: hypothetical protein GY710_13090 [Desulfobacteraceae bacterium]|nr:hypothetical protein [Desulfobacteraceae bacterium]
MGKKPSEGNIDIHSIFCPTCGKPGDKIQEDLNNLEETIVVVRCLKCDTVMASGFILGLRAVCYHCGDLVVVS